MQTNINSEIFEETIALTNKRKLSRKSSHRDPPLLREYIDHFNVGSLKTRVGREITLILSLVALNKKLFIAFLTTNLTQYFTVNYT